MLDKIKRILKGNEIKETEVEKFDCKLNPFLKSYYEGIRKDQIKPTIKDIKNTIYINKLYIGFLKEKIKENNKFYDSDIFVMYECLLTKEILDKEYMNNTAKHIIEFLKYRERVYKAKEEMGEINNG